LDALSALHLKPDATIAVAQAESILTTQNEQCLATLRELRGALVELTGKLVERETLDGEEVAQAISNARTAGKKTEGLSRASGVQQDS
jgi:ATP-dependent Zn protease